MSEQQSHSPASSARIVHLSARQPVRIAALLHTSPPTCVNEPTPDKVVLGNVGCSNAGRVMSQGLPSSHNSVYREMSRDIVDDVVSCMEDDSNNDNLIKTGIGIDSLGETTTFQLLSQEEVEEHGLQAVALGNDESPAATILQCTHGPDGQIFIPVHQLNSTSLSHGFVVATSSTDEAGVGTLTGGNMVQLVSVEESARRRQLRLLKNKEAAKECRRKKKEYVRCLENRVAVLENQNRTLIDELKSLKELYCQKDLLS